MTTIKAAAIHEPGGPEVLLHAHGVDPERGRGGGPQPDVVGPPVVAHQQRPADEPFSPHQADGDTAPVAQDVEEAGVEV